VEDTSSMERAGSRSHSMERVDADADPGQRMAGTQIRGGGPFHGDRAGSVDADVDPRQRMAETWIWGRRWRTLPWRPSGERGRGRGSGAEDGWDMDLGAEVEDPSMETERGAWTRTRIRGGGWLGRGSGAEVEDPSMESVGEDQEPCRGRGSVAEVDDPSMEIGLSQTSKERAGVGYPIHVADSPSMESVGVERAGRGDLRRRMSQTWIRGGGCRLPWREPGRGLGMQISRTRIWGEDAGIAAERRVEARRAVWEHASLEHVDTHSRNI
jgi:hypothetical protein